MENILTLKQQGIVATAAFTATGNLAMLKATLEKGLEAGVTISELKEVMVKCTHIPDFQEV